MILQRAPSAAPLIDIEDLCLTLTSRAGPVDILKHVRVTIDPGQSVAIVGPSGSGKTSLLMVLAGLERATSGRVNVVAAISSRWARMTSRSHEGERSASCFNHSISCRR